MLVSKWESTTGSLPGAEPMDRIVVITESGRTEGVYSHANTVGIAFTCDHGLRFIPWSHVRVVLMPGTEERMRQAGA